MIARLALPLALALLPVLTLGAQAHDESSERNQVSFSVDASREVANDRVRATVGVTEEGSDPAALAERVNQTMTWALGVAKAAVGVKAQSGAYQTQPVYDKGQIRRWRASQDLILQSHDVAAVVELIGTLQGRLLLRGIDFHVSAERRRQVEGELIQEGLAAFRERAELVRKSLERRGYTIVRINVATRAAPPRSRGLRQVQAEAVSVPALASGESTVTVSISATIELE